MSFRRFLALLLLSSTLLVLQACGAARDEPFDPEEPENETPETVNITFLIEGTENRIDPENTDRAIFVARTVDEYIRLQDIYILDTISRPAIPDMDAGHVVFYDGGIIDNRNCAAKLILRSFTGEATTDDLVTLVLRLEHFVPSSTATCTGDPQESRTYTVLYVPTPGEIMIREERR